MIAALGIVSIIRAIWFMGIDEIAYSIEDDSYNLKNNE